MLGIWKDFSELEDSLSMPELSAVLKARRDSEYSSRKFAAALKGVDLDKAQQEEDPWEKLKAKVASRGATTDTNDILSLQGQAAAKAGFGIGMGLEAEVIDAEGNVTKYGG